ncbi:hypothetical protein HOG48_02980, partial [Candidatus Peregrinibacteria bacterium]|nr:hypothetical protein [Candidatus Peregrinibacteria bacterium]
MKTPSQSSSSTTFGLALTVIVLFCVINTVYALDAPTSQLITEKQLEERHINKAPIEKVEFLNIEDSRSPGLSEAQISAISLDPEFQKQVKELEAR